MDVLVIVDMQVGFVAAQDADLVERINAAVNATVKARGRVISVCFDGHGMMTTLPGSGVIWKNEDDGGPMVYAWLVGAGLVHQKDLRVTVCGVNLCACVMATAAGIGQRLYDEHAMCDNVTIDTSLCGDGSKFKVRFKGEK